MCIRDRDGDGFGNGAVTQLACTAPNGFVAIAGDCNDSNPNINPSSNELCDNVDNNCNNSIDEGLSLTQYYEDNDGDGFGNSTIFTSSCDQPAGFVTQNGDCNDQNPNIHPNAPEQCDNIDNNCNNNIDEGAAAITCLLYTSPSPRDRQKSRMPSSA